jgi:hypothetical protein
MNQTGLEIVTRTSLQGRDRRREPRFKTSQPVVLTVMGSRIKPVMEGCILNISDRGLRVRIPQQIPAGTVIKADAGQIRMLGEVVRCVEVNGAYHVGVQLFNSLSGATELNRLNRQLLQEEGDLLSGAESPGRLARAMVRTRC